ncbi:MAG: hypothetical protein PVF74_09600 [Anaerolineales bacterium]
MKAKIINNLVVRSAEPEMRGRLWESGPTKTSYLMSKICPS